MDTSRIVSFGNSLFEAYKIKDENGNCRQVSDSDITRWLESSNDEEGLEIYPRQLRSPFGVGDYVRVILPYAGEIQKAKIIKLHFTSSHTMCDLEIEIKDSESSLKTRVYNVDCSFLTHL